MLLTVSAMATLRCSSGGVCGDGTKVYGFCASDAASDAESVLDTAYPGFYGFADAAPDATSNDASTETTDAALGDGRE